MLLQAAIQVGHQRAAQALARRLAFVAHLSIGQVAAGFTCIARHLGDAAVLAGDWTAAQAHYAKALESAGKLHFRPELALTHLRMAELLLQEGSGAGLPEALEHLEVAIPELQDMHMQPALERARALSEKYRPVSPRKSARLSGSETLTAREREIVSLMGGGRSNREIAERLVISEGTVEVHVKHILSKLGFSSRVQVATWLADRRSDEAVEDLA
jgi:DNA-binding CsgD family transcriptional regulator